MLLNSGIHVLVGLLPVVCFLAALLYGDSYKLVRLPVVISIVGFGALAAAASYVVSVGVLSLVDLDLIHYSRYVAPVIEESLKGAVIIVLVKSRRVGFLVDAAILGFAAGTGFALVENIYIYLIHLIPETDLATWIVRGFGTAIMHGGTTAIFGVMASSSMERYQSLRAKAIAPGLAIAIVVHSAYNHGLLSPISSTLAILVVLPPALYLVFEQSERAVGDWLDKGFESDADMLELINSGHLSDSPVGEYLRSLRKKFQGPIVADILCYLRLYTELSLRAKGILMARESGLDIPIDALTRAKFDELQYLQGSIGKACLLTIQPMLRISHKDLWQLYMLDTKG
jgi:protease PrsW